jgi:hypothetical protein
MGEPLTFEAQVARRRSRSRLQAEMGSDWTEGRQIAHDEADAIVHRQRSLSRRVTLSHIDLTDKDK